LSIAYLDTHVAVFLAAGALEEFSKEAKRQIDGNDLLISPMVYLEFDYLHSRQKIKLSAKKMYSILNLDFGIQLCQWPFAKVAKEASELHWTNDPFDRIIVAQALVNQEAMLITRDRLIAKNYRKAIW
jgi:PIN domain nuclease of toxin-antitoxin system